MIADSSSNVASLPPRLPCLSEILKGLGQTLDTAGSSARFTIVALSYRGFWKSSGRASQKGLELDAAAVLGWVSQTYMNQNDDVRLVLWGQSVGAGIAMIEAARYENASGSYAATQDSPRIAGVLLETPFVSIREMLVTLYPQKWLPYRYLWPFLWNHWDARIAFQQFSKAQRLPRILILQAEKDELVPFEHGLELHKIAKGLGMDVERKIIQGALHAEVSSKSVGRYHIVTFLGQFVFH